MSRIGVFICHCGKNISRTVDIPRLRERVSDLANVVLAKDYLYFCSKPGQKIILDDIREHKLDRILIAACSPKLHGRTFARVARSAGLNSFFSDLANIREHCSWVHTDIQKATEKALDIIKGSAQRLLHAKALQSIESPITKRVLVVGGGVAGIQAALDIAESGFEVYLVEKSPSLGGRMAQLGETFPTLDCSSCILTPKMVEAGQNERIHLLTYSEVVSVEGNIGQFRVRIRRNPRYIDEALCTGCGDCVGDCPVVVSNEFDRGLGARKAVYIPFPQAVPAVYTIDWGACLNSDKLIICENCFKACETKAVNFLMAPKEITVEVGAVILAAGYELMPAAAIGEYGGDNYEDVIDSLQFERMLSASGPTGGVVRCPSDGRIPKSIVFIQCSGSRDPEHGVSYCSRVCCMYTAKHALLYQHAVPDGRSYVFYIDIRAGGKNHEEFIQQVMSHERILYLRGKVSKLFKAREKMMVWGVDTLSGRQVQIEADLVVLAMAAVPAAGIRELAQAVRVSTGQDGFLSEAHPKLRPLESETDGIFLAGAVHFPKDITDTVAQASGAAGKALSLMSRDFISLDPTVSQVEEDLCRGCGLCMSVCPYGAVEMKVLPEAARSVAEINPITCKGCGLCAASCISGAISLKGFSWEEIYAQLEGII
ncbi:MAG: CoB--CoM heterodisulfide reductase iron-sulfur subunit A family protein [Pseudomonadota bacterium]